MSATAFADVDLGSMEFWGRSAEARDQYFAHLRAQAPISRHEPPEDILGLPQQGRPEDLLGLPQQGRLHYWAIVRHEDIRRISRDPLTFCSSEGVQFADAPPEMLEASQSFLAMDAPRLTKLRGLVSAAFTPRQCSAPTTGPSGSSARPGRGCPRRSGSGRCRWRWPSRADHRRGQGCLPGPPVPRASVPELRPSCAT